ncbi:hypothetical protein KAR91_57905 [Candidatus Pacearchaeota archaeon]|nr:hypothetical protein [Candidatus Pacearchaeota archaeon]
MDNELTIEDLTPKALKNLDEFMDDENKTIRMDATKDVLDRSPSHSRRQAVLPVGQVGPTINIGMDTFVTGLKTLAEGLGVERDVTPPKVEVEVEKKIKEVKRGREIVGFKEVKD